MTSNIRPIVICMTPVKNEAWILDVFLTSTSLWADYIIIADQNSSDGSREIAQRYEKVILIDNISSEFNEPDRQKLLLNESRKIEGKKLLVALDADEIFTSNFQETEDWKRMLNGIEGEVFGFEWVNVLPKFNKAWINKGPFPWAIIDDGSEHTGKYIHSPRIPLNVSSNIIPLTTIKVLHLQYLNWTRMESKQRYYQCLERVKFPDKPPVEIYRMYHHMYSIPKSRITEVLSVWVEKYIELGLDFEKLSIGKKFWFDDEIKTLINTYGAIKFKRDEVWSSISKAEDPRNLLDKLIHKYMKLTQPYLHWVIVKKIDRFLKFHY